MRVGLVVALLALLLAGSASAAAPPILPAPGQGSVVVPVNSDPSCARPAGLSVEAAANCRMSGSPESPDPVANWGLDTHVDVGTVDPRGQAEQTFDDVLGWLFGALVTLVDVSLQMVSAAFSFDLFGRGQSQVASALNSMTTGFTTPLLPLAVVVGGLVAMRHWWGSHSEARVIRHWVVMGALIVAGLVIVADPVGLFGGLSRSANDLGSSTLSVVSGGSARGGRGFASAEAGLWEAAVQRPWCQLEFGDTQWCMASPDARMVAARPGVVAHLTSNGGSDSIGDQGPGELAVAEAPLIRQRLLAARTNGELFSAFQPNWNARNGKNASWSFLHVLVSERPDLAAARGPSGIGKRLGNLVLIWGGGLMFVTLLAVIATALFVASIGFVLLLLLVPLVILLPAFEWGQALALKWALALVLALASKVVYSLLLGVLIRVQDVVLSITASGGWLLAFGIWTLVWFMAFKHRHAVLGAATGGLVKHKHLDPVRPVARTADAGKRFVAGGERLRRHRGLRGAVKRTPRSYGVGENE